MGKTTLANIIAKTLDVPFFTLSAVTSGVKEVREVIEKAKAEENAGSCGMYLVHNGTVRETARAQVRGGQDCPAVTGMDFSFDREKVERAMDEALEKEGILCVKVWLNSGHLQPGDDIMMVLVGGDIRPRVTDALFALVETIKTRCVVEKEQFYGEE